MPAPPNKPPPDGEPDLAFGETELSEGEDRAVASDAPPAPPAPPTPPRAPTESFDLSDLDDLLDFAPRPFAAPPAPRAPAIDPLRIPHLERPESEFAFKLGEAPPLSIRPPSPDEMSRPVSVPPVPGDLTWEFSEAEALAVPATSLPPTPASSDQGDAYSLVERASSLPAAVAPPDPRREMQDRFALGDFSGALVVAEALVAEGRADERVESLAQECRARLEQMYAARLGGVTQVPAIAVPRGDLKWLSLDHRAGFVLSLVDGASSIEEIIDVAGMPALEVLRTLYELLSQRVLEVRPPAARPRR